MMPPPHSEQTKQLTVSIWDQPRLSCQFVISRSSSRTGIESSRAFIRIIESLELACYLEFSIDFAFNSSDICQEHLGARLASDQCFDEVRIQKPQRGLRSCNSVFKSLCL